MTSKSLSRRPRKSARPAAYKRGARPRAAARKPLSFKTLPELAADHPARLSRLREGLAQRDLPAALITNPLDVAYLTGFLGGDSYLLVTPSTVVIISDFRYQEELAPLQNFARIHIRSGAIAAAVGEVIARERLDRLAIQAEHVTLASQEALAKAVGRADALVPAADLLQPMRAVKDAAEVRLIRNAAAIQQQALLATLPAIKPGMTELQVAARLEAEMKALGSSAPAFETIVAARAFGSHPHYRPGRVKLAANQPLLIDWGATSRGYRSDMTRTFALGRWPAKLREVYRIVLDAHLAAAAALAPGKSTREIDAVARSLITRHGFGDAFGHGLGHGIGLNVHEEPRLSHMTPETMLVPGMVVTIEPGIYLPGVGGVRLENDYLVTDRGAENLCGLPLDIDWATL